MSNAMGRFGRQRGLEMFADWTDRDRRRRDSGAAATPQGKERSVVVTLWDWGQDSSFIHDEIVTDKRNPTMYGYGPVYGSRPGTAR